MDHLIIGTYTDTESRGLYQCSLLPFGEVNFAAEVDNPSYMWYSTEHKRLYVVSESVPGKITVYDTAEGHLIRLGLFVTNSAGLVHITADCLERYLFVASYEDAGVMMIKLSAEGLPERISYRLNHTGSSVNPARQDRAHAHSVWLTPDEKELCVCDLGMDSVIVYEIDYRNGILFEKSDRTVRFPAGAGPRHMTFNPGGTRAYVLTELTSQVFVYEWSAVTGFTFLQNIDLLAISDPSATAAALRMSSDGRFLYTSCRGADSIVVFSVQEDGCLSKIQAIAVQGKHPRDILLSKKEDILFAACRDTDTVSCFDRNSATGLLRFSTVLENIPEPIALQLI
jgi:6-phosphogluconolactonase